MTSKRISSGSTHALAPNGRPDKGRGLGKFRDVAEEQRRNPQSLRKILYDIANSRFDGQLKPFANAVIASRAKRSRNAQISDNVLYELLRDKQMINYAHIEALALYLNMPAAAILLYSRILSCQAREEHVELAGIIRAMEAMIADIKEKIPLYDEKIGKRYRFSQSDFDYWQSIFKTHLPRIKSSLPLGD